MIFTMSDPGRNKPGYIKMEMQGKREQEKARASTSPGLREISSPRAPDIFLLTTRAEDMRTKEELITKLEMLSSNGMRRREMKKDRRVLKA